MSNSKIEQGTIIYGIRSSKYPSAPCYGVIITARCDIAQGKVPKYYYLVGVDAELWLSSAVGYVVAYKDTIGTCLANVKQKAQEIDLDGDTLIGMEDSEIEIILSDVLSKHPNERRIENRVKELKDAVEKYHSFYHKGMSDIDRKRTIKANNKQAVRCIKEIDSGAKHHYYYLPQNAYFANGEKGKGLVIDLLEINSISIEDAIRITDPFKDKIIFENLPKLPEPEELREIVQNHDEVALQRVMQVLTEYERMKTTYWLEDDSCFVDIEGTIHSPYCEHLMQRFSNVFVRIGIDNPVEDDFYRLVQRINDEGV